ncbi:hypothetical protein COY26_05460 [Candidatus Woesearchaeota archaeon CG_4_10_14_0_2_um_filter_33_10]|nr:MAG: hypothetical protein COV14_02680 [Candidatus Woesearchaeota archaeon CG10_big_fil_rev_8_21_14_0_10_33_12]PIU72180.1 MAG: hypothetical protein COS79_04370 [Candidatus Woesearchaeota archaeon CG06_land_8_20_14_3_00_33_13]PIZ51849.1 MAG: hypothetical protein COY26_05460 [Candidatus Woesearchaeota archaeon CG_4_10_14_0_2_um_filter_33_10]
MIERIEPEIIPYKEGIQTLCKLKYYKHSKGCPNYNKKEGCPPNQPLINNVLDFDRGVYVICTDFAVGKFAERMRLKHPEWSEHPRQWYNPRLWQPKARKLHRAEQAKAIEENGLTKIISSPEAHGVNVTELMKNIGIPLRWGWPPKHIVENQKYLNNTVYLVSLGGYELNA